MSNLNLNSVTSLDTGREVDVNRVMQTVDYVGGLVIDSRDTIIVDGDDRYVLTASTALPYTTTGEGMPEDGAFVSVGDAVLRQDLANPNKGAAMVARGVVAVDSIADLLALPEGQRRSELRYLVESYHAGTGTGGGSFFWDESGQPGVHNGGTVIDPLAPFPSDWGIEQQLVDWFNYESAHSGRYVICGDLPVSPMTFGAGGDGVSDDTIPLKQALLNCSTIDLRGATYFIHQNTEQLTFEGLKGRLISGPGVIRIKQNNVVFGGCEDITFRDVNFKTDTEYLSAQNRTAQLNFSNYKDISFINCVFDEWGKLDGVSALGEQLTFNVFETDRGFGYKAGNSSGARVIGCTFDGGKDRGTSFAIRVYGEFELKTSDAFEYLYNSKDTFISDCSFYGFDWNAVEFASPSVGHGFVNNCTFHNCGIAGPEVDKGAHNITMSNIEVDGVHGSHTGQLARGISMQGHLAEDGYIFPSKNVRYINWDVKNVIGRSFGIYVSRLEDCSIEGFSVTAVGTTRLSKSIEFRESVIRVDIKNGDLSGFSYGIVEENRKGSFNRISFSGLNLSGLKSNPIVINGGQLTAVPDSTFNMAVIIDGLYANTNMSMTDDLYVNTESTSLIELRVPEVLQNSLIRINNSQIESSTSGNALIAARIFRAELFNIVSRGCDNLLSADSTIKRLFFRGISPGNIVHIDKVSERVPPDCYMYDNTTGGLSEFVGTTPSNGRFIGGSRIHNPAPVTGDDLGWVFSDNTWKSLGKL